MVRAERHRRHIIEHPQGLSSIGRVFRQSQIDILSLLGGHFLLVPASAGNERRKARGRRHDQLPRESGKAEHQARPRARGESISPQRRVRSEPSGASQGPLRR